MTAIESAAPVPDAASKASSRSGRLLGDRAPRHRRRRRRRVRATIDRSTALIAVSIDLSGRVRPDPRVRLRHPGRDHRRARHGASRADASTVVATGLTSRPCSSSRSPAGSCAVWLLGLVRRPQRDASAGRSFPATILGRSVAAIAAGSRAPSQWIQVAVAAAIVVARRGRRSHRARATAVRTRAASRRREPRQAKPRPGSGRGFVIRRAQRRRLRVEAAHRRGVGDALDGEQVGRGPHVARSRWAIVEHLAERLDHDRLELRR